MPSFEQVVILEPSLIKSELNDEDHNSHVPLSSPDNDSENNDSIKLCDDGQESPTDKNISNNGAETANVQPCAENEVFVGGISKTVTEEDLNEMFSTVGPVRQIRLMKDKVTGESKGYAFVSFQDKSHCQPAVDSLNNKDLKGKPLRVKFSENRRKIFLGNLPKEFTKDQITTILNENSEGIISIDLLSDPDNSNRNRGFAFIEYSDHYLAEKARKTFSMPNFKIGTSTLTVNWADPVTEPNEKIMKQVKVIYVRNLPESRNETEIKALFEPFGTIEKVIIPVDIPGQQRRDFGFVHFTTRESAEETLKSHEKNPISYQGRHLSISLAKPMDKKQRADLRNRKIQRTVTRIQQQHQPTPTSHHNGGHQVPPQLTASSLMYHHHPTHANGAPVNPNLTLAAAALHSHHHLPHHHHHHQVVPNLLNPSSATQTTTPATSSAGGPLTSLFHHQFPTTSPASHSYFSAANGSTYTLFPTTASTTIPVTTASVVDPYPIHHLSSNGGAGSATSFYHPQSDSSYRYKPY
eukprot:gene6837-8480_t